jgi:hypothetical protein
MVRATFAAIVSAAILAGGGVAYSAESDSQGAKEFAPQQVAMCCFIKQIEELADAKRENADLARQLAAAKAAQDQALSGQRADAERAKASKECDNADMVRQSDQKVLIKR